MNNTQETIAVIGVLHNVFYRKPTEHFIEQIQSTGLLAIWPERENNLLITKACNGIGTSLSQDSFDQLERDYYRLFIGPGAALAYPWGSVYTDRENLVCGQTTLNFREFCRQHQFEISTENNEPQDHFAIVIAVLAALLEQQNQAGANELLEQHLLPWGYRMLERVSIHSQTDYFRGFAYLAAELLKTLQQQGQLQVVKQRLYF